MDPLRIAIRAVAAFLFLLALLRLSGKRTIYQGSAFDFVLALILGDMIDNAIFNEVPFAVFATGSLTLVGTKLLITLHKGRANA
jgi:uncharacterized membrane protein YcaP (DUF421 family)